ncbi:MAG: hypothetical protein GX958_00810 [Desulfitobacterium sp.]|nr:hypothetical protein [Desulfitobacterium sp.]
MRRKAICFLLAIVVVLALDALKNMIENPAISIGINVLSALTGRILGNLSEEQKDKALQIAKSPLKNNGQKIKVVCVVLIIATLLAMSTVLT